MAKDAIVLEHVTRQFGDFTAVDDVSLRVRAGELFAFLGPNGAGKSTTIKMLTTLLRPTSGTVRLADHDVVTEQAAARQRFGVVFQDPSLDEDLTAYENMELHATLYGLPKQDIPQRAGDLLRLVELDERRDAVVRTFSGGMKRRLEIARGLLHAPAILFLDEPTLGLDTQTRRLLWDYVRQLSQQNSMTVFFTTHYIEEAEEVADRIAMIDHGKIIALGTTQELTKQTKTATLEEAYLALTGKNLRDETISSSEAFRNRAAQRRGVRR